MCLRNFFYILILFYLIGCGVNAPTEPASLFGADIVAPILDKDSYSINEGQTAFVKIKFDRKTKVRTYINWEIRGGIGRFLKPTGVFPVAADIQDVEIPLESYRNEVIDPVTDFEVVIQSDSFAAPVTVMLKVTDLTVPANLTLAPTPILELPVVGVAAESTGSLTLSNVGQIPARSISPSVFSDAQMYFLGGSFPGIGGTCTSVLAAGGNCTVTVGATLASSGALELPLVFSYNNGTGIQTKSISVRASADSTIAVLSGTPSGASKTKILDITVGGAGIDNYKYKIGASPLDCSDPAGYSGSPVVVATHITQDISAIPDGNVKICVVGFKMGTQQSFSAATTATWFKDTTPPDIIGNGITINNGDSRTRDLAVQLKMTTNGSQFMYITNSAGCSIGGTWEVYTQTKNWNISFANSNNQVYVKFRDALGNETACINSVIVHDNLPPSVLINQSVAQVDPTLALPVSFLAVFSEDVLPASFSTAAIEQTGTANGVSWTITPITGSQYKVEAVSATSGGSIIPRIRGSIVMDLAGNASEASSSTDASVSYSLIEFYFKSVSLGTEQGCAFANDGKLYCWGSNANFQLGIGPVGSPPSGFSAPQIVDYSHLAGVQFKKVAVGAVSTCALSIEGKLYCWGKGDHYTSGQFNSGSPGTKIDQKIPAEVVTQNVSTGYPCSYWSWVTNSLFYNDVSVGKTHVCAVELGGHPICFGMTPIRSNSTPEYSAPNCAYNNNLKPAGKNVVQISSGGFGSCLLNAIGDVYCFGRNNMGQLGDSSTTDSAPWVKIHTAGIVSGLQKFMQVSAGDDHACAVAVDGKAYCWGQGTKGQIGDGSFSSRAVPTLVNVAGLGPVSFVEVKAGLNHTCARTTRGQIYCWGEAAHGKLGNSSITDQAAPTLVTAVTGSFDNIVSLEVGDNHSCAIKSNGQMSCWGAQGAEGRLGNNDTQNATRPALVQVGSYISKRSFSSLSVGFDNSCAVGTDGLPYCWGAGVSGKLGNGSIDRLIPISVNMTSIAGVQFTQIATGIGHTCGLATSGKIYCWGQNNEGQLGNGTTVSSSAPVEVDTNINGLNDPSTPADEFLGFKSISVGYSHTCALYATGKPYCWGYGLFGQLGSGSTLSQSRPQAIFGSVLFRQVDTGDYHSCGVSFDNKAYCWGWGALGRLGNGATDNKLVPTQVDTTLNPQFIARTEEAIDHIRPGADHTCMKTFGKSVYCWGSGLDGRLGADDSTEATKLYPSTVDMTVLADVSGVADVESGKDHSCLLTQSGKAACWGAGLKGRLGDGDFLDKALPVLVNFSEATGYLGSFKISAGGSHTCALSVSGEQYCWGEGLNGRLGNNSATTNQSRPVNVLFP